MTLQKRTAAPGKARREASKGKPRRAVEAKAAKKAAPAPRAKNTTTPRTASKATPRTKGEFKPTTTVRYSDRDAVPATRKEARLSDRSKLRAARFQKEIGSKSKDVEGAPKGNPRQSASERVFEKGGKPKSRAAKFVAERNERPERRSPERTERPARSFDKPKRTFDKPARSFDKPARSFDKPERTSRPADRTERPARSFDKPARTFDKPERTSRPTDRTERPAHSFEKPARTFDKQERTSRPADRTERPARSFDKPARSFDKPARDFSKPPRDRRTATGRNSEPHSFSQGRGRNVAEDFGADDSYISPNLADANLIDATPLDAVAKTFRDLGIPAALDNALSAQGILSPFPIQVATVPDAIAGHDILGRGQTGSGKTLAFSLALLSNIAEKRANPHKPLALILTPTRELAQQIDEVLLPLARSVGHASVVIAGGMSYTKQITAMRKGTAILVATPGRLIDLLNKGEVQLDQLEITVLDEADQMADMGFLPVVQEILDQAKQGGQRLLFSATLDRGVDALVRRYLKNPKTHSLQNDRASVSTMEHFLLVMDPSEKDEVTAEIAARNGKTILFVKTQRGADRLADKLAHAGVPVGALHGGKSQAVRTRTLALFKESENAALVATDVAARGIHVDGISLVVHVDPAQDHKDYLHRSGRTARAGESGTVVSLATTRQQKSVKGLTTRAGVNPSTVYVKPSSEELMRVTGAQQPSGIPYVVPIVEAPKRAPRKGGSGGGGGRGYRGNRSGGNGGRGRR
ncbi:SF2_C_DEAD domain containing protein [Candidatus Nanopelagicaceae bacterium]